MEEFNGEAAFITGGGSGVGFGQAMVFFRAGAKVVLAEVRQDHLDQVPDWFSEEGGAGTIDLRPLRLAAGSRFRRR